MCGIVGLVRPKSAPAKLAGPVKEMADAIRHRGPDDEGYVFFTSGQPFDAHGADTQRTIYPDVQQRGVPVDSLVDQNFCVALGHRRLSIIDRSPLGHQPMPFRRRYWITYNGEVFNYIEIRQELETAGYEFDSSSDTEVVLAAYDRWGPGCLSRFNGMWAFVIYDLYEHRVFISRDRFGIKPLYFHHNGRQFMFASEIKALIRANGVPCDPNESYCREYLAYGPNEYDPNTAFHAIQRFPHGCYHEGPADELATYGLSPIRYWKVSPNIRIERFHQNVISRYADEYFELLSDSVRLRLRADVEVGAALSGGLDSSSIAYLAARHTSNTDLLETFSSVYTTPGTTHCDESGYIRELAQFIGVRSNTIEPRLIDIPEQHRLMVYAMDNPPAGPNMGGWYTFKRVAQTNVVINLDGQGADEQMAGYHSYIWRYIANTRFSDAIREVIAFRSLPELKRSKLVAGLGINLISHVTPASSIRSMARLLSKTSNEVPVMGPLNTILAETVDTNLVNLLHFGDSQSMAHSVESRVPFLDYRLVEFLASVPAVYKVYHGWTKYLARVAFADILPARIVWRRDKMGWPDPTDYWFRGPLKDWLCREVESSAFLRDLGVGGYVRQRLDSQEPILPLIRLLNLSVWFDVFFGRKKHEAALRVSSRV